MSERDQIGSIRIDWVSDVGQHGGFFLAQIAGNRDHPCGTGTFLSDALRDLADALERRALQQHFDAVRAMLEEHE
jgi:hypothetical protein